MKKIFLYLNLFLISGIIYAGGYRVNLQGIRQTSMGNTSVMHVRDASVAFYNPAGIAFIDSKISVAAGVYGVFATSKYQNRSTGENVETDSDTGTPFYFAATYKPTDKLALGLSVTTPFGSTVSYPDGWSGETLIQDITLQSFFIQPTVAYKFSDWFSMGAGFIYATGNIELERIVKVAGSDVLFNINDDDAVGLGYNIGFFFKPDEKLNIGVAYRSKIDIEANNGETQWNNLPASLSNTAPFFTDEFGAELPLPAEYLIGLSYQVTPKLLLSGEVSWTEWADYRNLEIDLIGTPAGSSTEVTIPTVSTRNYSDEPIWRLGAEYNATDKLDLRAGYYYDPTPSPSEYWSPETPSVSQHAFTAGIGYKVTDSFIVDAYGHYLYGKERSVNNIETGFAGDVKSTTYIVGLGLTYNVGDLFKKEESN